MRAGPAAQWRSTTVRSFDDHRRIATARGGSKNVTVPRRRSSGARTETPIERARLTVTMRRDQQTLGVRQLGADNGPVYLTFTAPAGFSDALAVHLD